MSLTEAERQALIDNYRNKSHAAIENVTFLLEYKKLTLAVNQIYYGMFYMLSAIAIQDGFTTSKHKQLIGWFNQTYIKSCLLDRKYSKMIQRAFESRMEGDYNALSSFSQQEVEEAFAEMQEVIAAIEKLLTEHKIEQGRVA